MTKLTGMSVNMTPLCATLSSESEEFLICYRWWGIRETGGKRKGDKSIQNQGPFKTLIGSF